MNRFSSSCPRALYRAENRHESLVEGTFGKQSPKEIGNAEGDEKKASATPDAPRKCDSSTSRANPESRDSKVIDETIAPLAVTSVGSPAGSGGLRQCARTLS